MSQKITLLYTKDTVLQESIPEGQIFFEEKGYMIFPLDIDEIEMEKITIAFKRYHSIQDLNQHRESFSNNAKLIIDLVNKLQLKTFLLEHYSDWADIPTDYYIMIVKDEKIYPDTDCDAVQDILDYFQWTENRENIVDIEKYKYYSTCENLFKNKNQ